MSKYVESDSQSLIWHYRISMDSDVLGLMFKDILNPGVLKFEYNIADIGTTSITIPTGSSFLLRPSNSPYDTLIGKCDIITNNSIDISSEADGTYFIIGEWIYQADSTAGVSFNVVSTLPGTNHIVLGVVVKNSNITSITTLNRIDVDMNDNIKTNSKYTKHFLFMS